MLSISFLNPFASIYINLMLNFYHSFTWLVHTAWGFRVFPRRRLTIRQRCSIEVKSGYWDGQFMVSILFIAKKTTLCRLECAFFVVILLKRNLATGTWGELDYNFISSWHQTYAQNAYKLFWIHPNSYLNHITRVKLRHAFLNHKTAASKFESFRTFWENISWDF